MMPRPISLLLVRSCQLRNASPPSGFGWRRWPIAMLISRARWQRFGPFACWLTREARARGRPHFSGVLHPRPEVVSTQIEDSCAKQGSGINGEVHHLRARVQNSGGVREPSSACLPTFSDRSCPTSEDARPWHPPCAASVEAMRWWRAEVDLPTSYGPHF